MYQKIIEIKDKVIKKIKDNNLIKRIMQALIFGIGGTVISKALLMLFNIIVARILGENQYGVYSILNNTLQTFTVFAGAGIGITLTRYVALYRDKDKQMAGILIKTLLFVNAMLSAVISIIVFILSRNISNLISEQIDITIYIQVTSFTIFFTSISLILQSALQGFEAYKKIAIIQIASNIITLIIGILITEIFGIIGTISALLLLQIISTVLFTIIIRKIIIKKGIKLQFQINDTVKEAIKKVAIPAFLASVFVVPLLWITNFVFTNKNGYNEFAAFSVCLQWYTILNYLPQQLGQVRPIYTQLYADGKIKELNKTIKNMILMSTGFATIVSIVLMIGSKLILKTYGEFYTAYIIPFIIMLVASIFYSIQSQYGSFFQAIGKIWLCLILNIVWAICFILCFALLHEKGALGYTITYLISYVIYSMISSITFYRVMKESYKKGKNIEYYKNEI